MNSTELEKIVLKFINSAMKPGFLFKYQGRAKRIQLYGSLNDSLITSQNYCEYSMTRGSPFMIAQHVCVEYNVNSLADPGCAPDPSIREYEKMVMVYTKVLYKAEFMGWISFAEFYFRPGSQKIECWERPNTEISPESYMQIATDIAEITEDEIC